MIENIFYNNNYVIRYVPKKIYTHESALQNPKKVIF